MKTYRVFNPHTNILVDLLFLLSDAGSLMYFLKEKPDPLLIFASINYEIVIPKNIYI